MIALDSYRSISTFAISFGLGGQHGHPVGWEPLEPLQLVAGPVYRLSRRRCGARDVRPNSSRYRMWGAADFEIDYRQRHKSDPTELPTGDSILQSLGKMRADRAVSLRQP